jgi:hypothetical protein
VGDLGARAPGGVPGGALIEAVNEDRVQVGFSLTLFVAAPMESAPGAPRTEAARKLWDDRG